MEDKLHPALAVESGLLKGVPGSLGTDLVLLSPTTPHPTNKQVTRGPFQREHR